MGFAIKLAMSPGDSNEAVVWPSGLRFETLMGAAVASLAMPPCLGVLIVDEETGQDAMRAFHAYIPPIGGSQPIPF